MDANDVSLVAVVSPKGGVGKTTVTACLAEALAALGHDVLVLDLDPQNALRLHLQQPFDDVGGHAVQSLNDAPWSEALRRSPSGIQVLPFGQLDEDGVTCFEALCVERPNWLADGLATLGLAPQTLVLLDTPPGSSPMLRQVLVETNAVLCVIRPEVSSFVTLGTMERWLARYCDDRSDFVLARYLINGVSADDALESEVVMTLASQLEGRLAPCSIRDSASLKESLAAAQAHLAYAPSDGIRDDYRALSHWLVTHV